MKIGFDCDGVLFNFTAAYQALVVRIAGVDLFQPGDDVNPPCWDWPEFRGYDADVMKRVWKHIRSTPNWWERLAPLDGAETLAMCMPDLDLKHDLYYATARAGNGVKRQTENSIRNYIGAPAPTVLIAQDKALVIAALRLDAYIDDNLDNIRACRAAVEDERAWAKAQSTPERPVQPRFTTRLFLLNRNYNQVAWDSQDIGYTRVRSVGQFLDYLTLGL